MTFIAVAVTIIIAIAALIIIAVCVSAPEGDGVVTGARRMLDDPAPSTEDDLMDVAYAVGVATAPAVEVEVSREGAPLVGEAQRSRSVRPHTDCFDAYADREPSRICPTCAPMLFGPTAAAPRRAPGDVPADVATQAPVRCGVCGVVVPGGMIHRCGRGEDLRPERAA